MSKMSKEIFEFFNNRETFKKTEKLLESFNEFQQELFIQFWNNLYDYIRSNLKLKNWVVEHETNRLDSEGSYILIRHQNDIKYFLYYNFYCKINAAGYGIKYEKESNPLDIEKLYEELQTEKYREKEWKFGTIKKSWMPLYYNLESYLFKEPKSFEKLLPDQVEDTIKQIGDQFINDFDLDLQNYIIKKLKDAKVIM